MHFFIEDDDDGLSYYYTTWDKVSTDIKREFDSNLSIIKII